jgi:hypothetical protein
MVSAQSLRCMKAELKALERERDSRASALGETLVKLTEMKAQIAAAAMAGGAKVVRLSRYRARPTRGGSGRRQGAG